MRRLHTILILIGFRLRANAPERQKRFPISISYQVRAELYRTVQRPGAMRAAARMVSRTSVGARPLHRPPPSIPRCDPGGYR